MSNSVRNEVCKVNLTEEQKLISEKCAIYSAVLCAKVKVIARAGTGKTKSLESSIIQVLASKYTDKPPMICYTTYNKSNALQFGDKMSKQLNKAELNVACIDSQTLNALCLQWFLKNTFLPRDIIKIKGHLAITSDIIMKYFDLENRLVRDRFHNSHNNNNINNNNNNHQTNNKRLNSRIKQEATWIATLIIISLNNYLNCDLKEVSEKHLTYQFRSKFIDWTSKLDNAATKRNIIPCIPARIYYEKVNFIRYVSEIYEAGLSNDPQIPLEHSIYQKYAQLNKAKLISAVTGKNIEVLLVDEAQDLNPCQYDIINTQQSTHGSTVILVGDPNQSIYQFRGASDHFYQWKAEETLSLTESFRFGKEISNICNVMLGLEKLHHLYNPVLAHNKNKLVVHAKTVDPLVRGQDAITDVILNHEQALEYPYTIICRTNNCIFNSLLSVLLASSVFESPLRKRPAPSDDDDDDDRLNCTENQRSDYHLKYRNNENRSGLTQDFPNLVLEKDFTDNKDGTNNTISSHSINKSFQYHTKSPRSLDSNLLKFYTPENEIDNENDGHTTLTPLMNSSSIIQIHSQSSSPSSVVAIHNDINFKSNVINNRKVYINGSTYKQLEDTLLHKIEKLSLISNSNSYRYNYEEYFDLDQLKSAAEDLEDSSMLELITMTRSWGSDIKNIKHVIKNSYADSMDSADVILTTIHKAKGLEWDRVALGEDLGEPLHCQSLFVMHTTVENNENKSVKYMIGLTCNNNDAYKCMNELLFHHIDVNNNNNNVSNNNPNKLSLFINQYPHIKLTQILKETYLYGLSLLKNINDNALKACYVVCTCNTHCISRTRKMFHYECMARSRLIGCENIISLEWTLNRSDVIITNLQPSNITNMESLVHNNNIDNNNSNIDDNSNTINNDNIDNNTITTTATTNNNGNEVDKQIIIDPHKLDSFYVKFSSIQNANEHYVAVSRAKKYLKLNKSLSILMEWIDNDIGGIKSSRLKHCIGNTIQ